MRCQESADNQSIAARLQLLYLCRDAYAQQLETLKLPVDADKLETRHKEAAAAAFAQFDRDKFGSELVSMSGTLRAALLSAIDKEFRCARRRVG